MAKSSPLARVIGFTRSFTPLLATPETIDQSTDEPATDTAEPALSRTTEVEVAPEVAIATRSGLRRLRVAAWSEASRAAAAMPESDGAFEKLAPPVGPLAETPESIEAGIASLLDAMSDKPEVEGSTAAPDDDGNAPKSIEDLLDELDRLWRADGEVGTDRLH